MLSQSSSRSSTSFILNSAPRTRPNKSVVRQEETAKPLGAANPVISNGSQPLSSSRYVDMLVKVDQTPFIRDFLAGLFTWLLLAGYIVFPRAFKSLDNANTVNELRTVGKTVLAAAQKGLLGFAAVSCILAAIGMGWL
jgi:hypothetical protein